MLEDVDVQNLEEVLPLIQKYQEFYKVKNIDTDKNREFFSQFHKESEKGMIFAYRVDNKLVAFATVYFTFASSIISKVAVMNDLFTLEPYRKRGIAKKLIEHCKSYAELKGASRLQWVTALDNQTAQSVYKSLGAKKSQWEFFTY